MDSSAPPSVERRTASIGGEPVAPPTEVGPGVVVDGKYRIERLLGRGGMGSVFAARHLDLDRELALKFVTTGTPEASARMVREARLASAIDHPHVARVFDVGTHDGRGFVVMELLEGETLADLVRRRGRLPAAEAIALLREACAGLAAAHARGIVHRDLKPSNLFLAGPEHGPRVLKVLDFGIAKEIDDTRDGALTASTSVLGSPYYMAPEQVRSARDADARADIWSLGVTLYELVSGDLPFKADTTPGVLAAVVADRPRPLPGDLPAGLDRVIERCLAKEPAARYPDAGALAAALADVGRPRHARRAAVASAVLASAALVAFMLVRGGEPAVVATEPLAANVPPPLDPPLHAAEPGPPPAPAPPPPSTERVAVRRTARVAEPAAPSAVAIAAPPPRPARADVDAATSDRH